MSRAAAAALAAGFLATLIAIGPPPAAASDPTSLGLQSNPLLRQRLGLDIARPAGEERTAKAQAPAARRARLFRCDEAPGGRCGIVRVPLDRARPGGKKIPIFFLYFRHRRPGPAREAIVASEGGPGGSVTQEPFLRDLYRQTFDPLLAKRDLILLDQRGVGRSHPIDCEQLQHGTDRVHRAVRACGRQLGSTASLYGSVAVARDIEAVRRALGIEKLDLFGRSYSAQEVQAYAVRFPNRVRVAVFDSPVTSVGFNGFDPYTVPTIARTVRLVCERSRTCATERGNAVRSLWWLAARLRRNPVEGVGYDADGNSHRVRVTEATLPWRLLQTDAGVYVSVSEIGAAADALRQGDPAPLLRLAAENDQGLFVDQGPPSSFSVGDHFARTCADLPNPWDKGASIPTRRGQWRAARDRLRPSIFRPFSIDAWLAPFPAGPIGPDACIDWPAPRHPVAPPVPAGARFPKDVPALILAGDLEAYWMDAHRLQRAWPNSRYVEVANSGHTTLTSVRGPCAGPIIVRFIAKLRAGRTGCVRRIHTPSIPAVGRFALTADAARPAKVDVPARDRSTVRDRRVATVATEAITDAFRRAILQSEELNRGRGLRGGSFTLSFRPRVASVKLTNARFARDVALNGTADYAFDTTESIDATVRIQGPGAEDGTLRVTGAWLAFANPVSVLRIRGHLAGRQLALQVPAR